METGQPDTFVSQATTRNQKVSIRMRIKYNLFILFGLQSKGTHWFVFAGSHWQKLWQELVFPLLKRNVATSHAAIKQWDKSLNVHQQRVLYTRSTQSNNREVNQKRNTFLKKSNISPLMMIYRQALNTSRTADSLYKHSVQQKHEENKQNYQTSLWEMSSHPSLKITHLTLSWLYILFSSGLKKNNNFGFMLDFCIGGNVLWMSYFPVQLSEVITLQTYSTDSADP